MLETEDLAEESLLESMVELAVGCAADAGAD